MISKKRFESRACKHKAEDERKFKLKPSVKNLISFLPKYRKLKYLVYQKFLQLADVQEMFPNPLPTIFFCSQIIRHKFSNLSCEKRASQKI